MLKYAPFNNKQHFQICKTDIHTSFQKVYEGLKKKNYCNQFIYKNLPKSLKKDKNFIISNATCRM